MMQSEVGKTEQNLKELFDSALLSSQSSPTILFIDELVIFFYKVYNLKDSLAVSRKTASKFESRIVTQLLSLMDDIHGSIREYPLIIIGATNKPDDLDIGIRRPGRFDREVVIEPPTKEERQSIIKSILQKHNMLDGLDVRIILI